MQIKLARIDDRLIHGQVTTVWAREADAGRIVVVSDEVAQDEIRRTLLKRVAPPGIKVNIVDIEKAAKVYKNPKYAEESVFLLFTCPQDVLRLVEKGVPLKSCNIGGMQFKTGKVSVTKAVFVNAEDKEAFHALADLGIELEIRTVATDPKVNILDKI